MYSPKIKPELIHKLYLIARAKRLPMTHLVNQIISEAIKDVEVEERVVRETPERMIEKKVYCIKENGNRDEQEV